MCANSRSSLRAVIYTDSVITPHESLWKVHLKLKLLQVKDHVERDHKKLLRYACDKEDCGQKFFKKCDLDVHKRYFSHFFQITNQVV